MHSDQTQRTRQQIELTLMKAMHCIWSWDINIGSSIVTTHTPHTNAIYHYRGSHEQGLGESECMETLLSVWFYHEMETA